MNIAGQTLYRSVVLGLSGLFLSFSAAADIRDTVEVRTGKAELVIPAMQAQDVTRLVKEAVSSWSIPASANVRYMPSVIPQRPDEPASQEKWFSGTPVIEYSCKTAYAEITKTPPSVKNAFYLAAERLQACVYPFQKGAKVYLIFSTVRKTEALTSGLFTGITKAIRGDDGDWMTKQLVENIDAIKKAIPSVLVEKIEVPGNPLQEPDKAAVAALIPDRPAQAAVAVQPAAAPVVGPVAAAPSTMAAKIEARKNLTAMGLQYHSQEQFLGAIQRNDDVAVHLYLDAGGIGLTAKGSNGKTPAEVANAVGALGVAKMITDRIEASATAAAPPAVAVPGTATAAALSNGTDELLAAKASLPPEILASLERQIDAMNVSAEQKEELRRQGIIGLSQQVGAIRQLTDRINPETGQLQ